jgi:hypothetical protein
MHYMSDDGTYLGSENADSGIVVLPTDEKTLLGIWKDADLRRPDEIKRDQASAAPGGGGARDSRAAPVDRTRPAGR